MGKDSEANGSIVFREMAQPPFHVCPNMLYRIFIWRILGQPENFMTIGFCDHWQVFFAVKAGIVQNDHTACHQQWDKDELKPHAKPFRISRPWICSLTYNFTVTISCYCIDPFAVLTCCFNIEFDTTFWPAMGSLHFLLDPCFINVYDRCIGWKCIQFIVKFPAFFFIPFLIKRLFF